jgi:hypothetical protein
LTVAGWELGIGALHVVTQPLKVGADELHSHLGLAYHSLLVVMPWFDHPKATL